MTDHAAHEVKPPTIARDGGQFAALDANVTSDRPAEAMASIEAFAKSGKGKPEDIPRLISRLDVSHRKQLSERYADLADRLPGALVLEVGEMLHVTLHFVVEDAIDAKPAVSNAVLRAFLRGKTAEQLAVLDDNTRALGKLRTHLPGPLVLELPSLADLPPALHGRPNLVRWFLQTTSPSVAALQLARSATPTLAATIAQLGTWQWIDQIAIASNEDIGRDLKTYRAVAPKEIQDKIDAKLVHHREGVEFEQGKVAARAELEERLKGRDPGPEQLLDAAARTGPAHELEQDVAKRLARENPSTILQYAATAYVAPAVTVRLLADKAAPQAVQAVLLFENLAERLAVLKDDKLRAFARRGLGRTFPLRGLIRLDEYQFAHDASVIG